MMHRDATEPMEAFGEFILTLNEAFAKRVYFFDCDKKYIIRNKKGFTLPLH